MRAHGWLDGLYGEGKKIIEKLIFSIRNPFDQRPKQRRVASSCVYGYEYVRLVKLKGRNPIEVVVVEQTSEKRKKERGGEKKEK